MRTTEEASRSMGRRAADGAGRRSLCRVLVAEDERDVAGLIREVLTREGLDVSISGTGVEALRLAREGRYDLVVLDLMLHQLSGGELCHRLKQDPATRAVPVIMVAARAEEGDKVLDFALGADDDVTKSFSARELVARIRAVTRRVDPPEAEERRTRIKAGDPVVDRQRFEVTMAGWGWC
jgi:DNA-binding response OmpR family regulator